MRWELGLEHFLDVEKGELNMAPEEFERYLREVAEFKGRAEEALRVANENITAIIGSLKSNHECICEVKQAVEDIQREIAVQKAVQKVKNGMYGAVGGFASAILVFLVSAFLKSKLFGGN
jgi:hypothetical protein